MSEQTLSTSHNTEPRKTGWITPILDILTVVIPFSAIAFSGVYLTLIGDSPFSTVSILGGMVINLAYLAAMLIGGWVLRRRGSAWTKVGLGRPESWKRTLLLALGTLVASLVVIVGVQFIALNLPGAAVAPVDETRFNPMAGNIPLLLGGVLAAWTTIAFGEEMLFRAFLITKFQEVFASSKYTTALAVATSTILFGAAHFAEGPLGLFSNGAFGLLLSLIYLRTGKNLWVTVIAHGLANTLRFVLIFLGA